MNRNEKKKRWKRKEETLKKVEARAKKKEVEGGVRNKDMKNTKEKKQKRHITLRMKQE